MSDTVVGAFEFIGAEMHFGTDEPGAIAALAEPYLAELLPAARTVLFAGAHDPAVVFRAAGGDGSSGVDPAAEWAREVTVQLSRVHDARGGHYPRARVLCGAIDHVPGTYDLVVCLVGLDRITSPDASAADAAGALAALAARVGPGGTLAVAAVNAFGLGRVNSLAARAERADPYAIGHGGLVHSVRAGGLSSVATMAVFPDLPSATLVIHHDLLDEPADRDLAALLVGAAEGGTVAPSGVVTDPRRLAVDAVTHGTAGALAGAWILVASRPGAADPLLPPIAVSGGTGRASLVTERAGGTGTFVPGTRMAGWSPQRRLPRGPLLSERIIAAAARNDLAGLRSLLTRYAAWLGGGDPTSEWAAADRAGVTPAHLIDEGAALSALDAGPALGPSAPASPPNRRSLRGALLAGLVDVASEMQSAGLPHPWPATVTVPRLAIALAAATGLTVAESEFDSVVPPPRTPAAAEEDAPPVGPMGTLARPRGYAEAVRLASETSRELAEARAQLRFLVEVIADRDLRLRDKSPQHRAARLLRHPLRTVVRRLRR